MTGRAPLPSGHWGTWESKGNPGCFSASPPSPLPSRQKMNNLKVYLNLYVLGGRLRRHPEGWEAGVGNRL